MGRKDAHLENPGVCAIGRGWEDSLEPFMSAGWQKSESRVEVGAAVSGRGAGFAVVWTEFFAGNEGSFRKIYVRYNFNGRSI